MLERYYVKPQTIDRIRASWLGESIERYVCWLTEKHYAPRVVFRRVPLLTHFGQFAWADGARRVEELPKYVMPFVEEWLQQRGKNRTGKRARQSIYREVRGPVQQFLRVVLPGYTEKARRRRDRSPFCDRVPGFFTYLQDERGLRKSSIQHYEHYLQRFEDYLNRIQLHDLNDLSPAILSAFVTKSKRLISNSGVSKPLSKSSMTALCGCLRVFLRYLHREQMILHDLSRTVESPRIYRLADLPRCISWEEVRRVLETVDQRTSLGRRDYAVLLLLTTYGLRAREVAALTLDDIDWKRERLRVPERKAGHSTAYPLSPIVGEAILAYLRQGRPDTSDRKIFFQVLAPYDPMTANAVSCMATHYLKKACVAVYGTGSHTFRHTCVQRLVESDFSYKTIGDYVGHRSSLTTQGYTKIGIEALREVAMGDGEEIL